MSVTALPVPSAFIAALKGLNGQKVKDMEKTSGASIKFTTLGSSSQFTNAIITGRPCQVSLAVRLIKLAVLHARAAVDPPSCYYYVSAVNAETRLDLRTFLAETISSRAHGH